MLLRATQFSLHQDEQVALDDRGDLVVVGDQRGRVLVDVVPYHGSIDGDVVFLLLDEVIAAGLPVARGSGLEVLVTRC
jgi:hypothetical protein